MLRVKAMSMSTGKQLVADPLMLIGDIMKAFQNFLDTENDFGLVGKGFLSWPCSMVLEDGTASSVDVQGSWTGSSFGQSGSKSGSTVLQSKIQCAETLLLETH